jgi:phenylpropionate dioxygenase-like ring-hydroxylating dioxygenase large terminal subunit
MLWVWPDGSPEASAAAAEVSPAFISELDSEHWQSRTGWFHRDLPISYETVVENVRGGGGGLGEGKGC